MSSKPKSNPGNQKGVLAEFHKLQKKRSLTQKTNSANLSHRHYIRFAISYHG